jgi:hypothetical protein
VDIIKPGVVEKTRKDKEEKEKRYKKSTKSCQGDALRVIPEVYSGVFGGGVAMRPIKTLIPYLASF